ncbi:uncharacterized protein LOC131943702 [Physella acuta]|uniref:uncharacterized protein LOC131943702 n=1 Tax=Physella acuta TaxID=109671 RepID=UPI0027DB55E2|nr:uncharacterized protein LOC131943702 [Physella acuta]
MLDNFKKQIVELTKQCSLLTIQVDEAKSDAVEAREVCKTKELELEIENDNYEKQLKCLREINDDLNKELRSKEIENDNYEKQLQFLREINEDLNKELHSKERYCAERENEIIKLYVDCNALTEELQSIKSELAFSEKEIRRQQKLENKLKITIKSLQTRLEIIRYRAENETSVSDNTQEGYLSLEEMLLMELCKLEKDLKDIKLDDEIEDDTQSTASAAVDDPTPAVRAHLSHLSHSYVNT